MDEYNFDISIDEEKLFKSVICVDKLEESLLNFKSSANLVITEDSEVNSILSAVSSEIGLLCDEVKNVSNVLKKDVNILGEISINVLLLFSLYDKGYLDEDLNWLIDFEKEQIMGVIYDQNLYGDVKYGESDLKTSGCGFFSVLSVITAKTGYVFYYNEISSLASYVGENASGSSNQEKMEFLATYLGDRFGFSWEKGPASEIISSLNDGKCVIGLTSNSGGNMSGHFVSITGILENGNIIVNDSDSMAARYHNPTHRFYSPDNVNRLNKEGFKYVYGSLSDSEFYITPCDGKKDVWYFII